MITIRSEEDKRLVNSLKKKSKKKKINVYFNKKDTKGKTKYISGNFYSEKNKSNYPYKSSYELAYLTKLEEDKQVVKYLYEPFQIPYIDFYKKQRNYLPDFMVLYASGKILITEIKPEAMLQDYDVKAKATAAKKFIEQTYPELDIEYQFITEKKLFKNITEYTKFIRGAKNG